MDYWSSVTFYEVSDSELHCSTFGLSARSQRLESRSLHESFTHRNMGNKFWVWMQHLAQRDPWKGLMHKWVTVVVKWKTEVGADWDVWKILGILWILLHNAQPLNSPDWLAKTGIWASCLRSLMLEWHQESWAHSSGNCLTNVNFVVLLWPEEHLFCTYAQKS